MKKEILVFFMAIVMTISSLSFAIAENESVAVNQTSDQNATDSISCSKHDRNSKQNSQKHQQPFFHAA